MIKNISTKQLTQLLLEKQMTKGKPVFVSITQFTSARLKKRGNPYPETMKLTQMTIILNTEYERAVHLQLAREGKDESTYERGDNTMPLTFGENNKVIGFFKGEPVLQYRPFDNSKPRTKYINEGRIIDKQEIEAFMSVPAETPTGLDSRQGTDKQIMIRKVYLKNVAKMTIDGVTYRVRENA
jgi:hypothetical protein